MLYLALLSLLAAVGSATPPLSFNCGDRLEDICTNMCWGAYCTQPAFGATLNYDNYGGTGSRTSATGKARTNSAGCTPNPNRCSTNAKPPNPKAGENCDEYPFASTSEADQGGQVTKCVIIGHNSRQGNILKTYYKNSCNNQPCQFIVGFGNPASANVKYCQAYSDPYGQCIPDGTIWKNGAADVRPDPPSKRDEQTKMGATYLMASGREIAFGGIFEIGTKTKHALPRNTTMLHWVDDNGGDEDLVEWDIEDDEIIAVLD